MEHLQAFQSRTVINIPTAELDGWQIKRYGILAKAKTYNPDTVSAALEAAINRLPAAGNIDNANGNHGVGIQIVHFAEVAVVSPVFYWIWGSVLAHIDQMRAPWGSSAEFETGVSSVVGCVWEMEIVNYETQLWKETVLADIHTPSERLDYYLNSRLPTADVL